MADLARIARVSTSTVSRALAGSRLVNAETRERIVALARSLNYSVHVGAQSLRLGQNRTIAVVVPVDRQAHQRLSDPFFLALIGALADALTVRGVDMLLSRVDAERLDLAAGLLHSGRAAGLVLVGQWRHHDQLNAMAQAQLPFVVWGAQLPGQRYPTVGSDNLRGGALAAAHLLTRGAKRVAFLGDPALPEVGQRHQGYLQAHARAGRAADPGLTRAVPFDPAAAQAGVDALLAHDARLDALFAAGDLLAMAAIAALRRAGRRVPEDVKVAGYDDIALAEHYHPSLTTVRQPMPAAGDALVEAVLARMRGEPAASTLLPTALVVRDSTRR